MLFDREICSFDHIDDKHTQVFCSSNLDLIRLFNFRFDLRVRDEPTVREIKVCEHRKIE